jgi:hypothetical protein
MKWKNNPKFKKPKTGGRKVTAEKVEEHDWRVVIENETNNEMNSGWI